MESRERVLAALDHREPDRVPVDLGATPSSGISAIAYRRWTERYELDAETPRVYDVVQQLAQPIDEILDRSGVDVIDVGRAFHDRDDLWYDTILPGEVPARFPLWFRPARQADGTWIATEGEGRPLAEMAPDSWYFSQTRFPYVDGYPNDYQALPEAMRQVHWAAFPVSPWDRASEEGFWDELRRRTLELRAQSDRALMIGFGGNLFEWGTFLRRMDNFLMDLVAEPEQVERLLAALVELHLQSLAKLCDAVGDVVDLIRFGDDLGMDHGPLLSPDAYRRFFQPHHRRMCEYVKTHSSMRPFLHSCGSIYALIPDLIEAGFEMLNPVQTSGRDMEPTRLKREFGRDVTFWGGGCDTREVLNRATPDQVRSHVRERMEVLAPGGGFVFCPIHNILPEVPPENVEAMFAAVRDFNGS